MSVVSSSNVVLWLLGLLTVSVHLCKEVVVTRKKIQRIAKEKLLVLDETHCRLSAAPTHSVALQGEDALVTVTDAGAYAARIDMIACIHESGALPAFTLTPAQRQRDGVKGLTTNHLIRFITHTLAPAVATLRVSFCCEKLRSTLASLQFKESNVMTAWISSWPFDWSFIRNQGVNASNGAKS